MVLGDIIISNGILQYDFGWQLPDKFVRKDTLLDSLGRPNTEIRALLAKLKGLRGRRSLRDNIVKYLATVQLNSDLAAKYPPPGTENDKLFDSKYYHLGGDEPCDECGCDGDTITRQRLQDATSVSPGIQYGLIASGDSIMRSGEIRDKVSAADKVVAFEMEGAGVWDVFPCVVIKAGCHYADGHINKKWQRYAAATAASCMKAFLNTWVPSATRQQEPNGPTVKHLIPYTSNPDFVGRNQILTELQKRFRKSRNIYSTSQVRVALFGLGGIGKTQIALAYAYWQQQEFPTESIFWVHASNAERFRKSYADIARECQIPGYQDADSDVLTMARDWLAHRENGCWLLVIDNADDMLLLGNVQRASKDSAQHTDRANLTTFLPDCAHGSILITTRNKQVGIRLTKGQPQIDIPAMEDRESGELLRVRLHGITATSAELSTLSSRLEYLPLALAQSAAFIYETGISVSKYLDLMGQNDKGVVDLLSKEFETVGRDSDAPKAVAQAWMISFHQIENQNDLASKFLSFMSIFDRQDIPQQFLSYYCNRYQNSDTQSALDIEEAIGVLKAFSFITEKPGGMFDMHRLVQLVTRKWLVNSGEMDRFLREGLLSISNLYPYGNFKNRETCATYLPHANAVLQKHKTISIEENKAKATLLHYIAAHLSFEGQWNSAEKLNIQARDIRQAIYGNTHSSTLSSIANLAETYRDQGRWDDAEKLQIQVMETRKIKLGVDHPDTLLSMANLAATYRNQGRWDEAEKLEIQVMETRKAKLVPDHPDTLTIMANLASTYRNQGRWDDAEKLEIQVMETRKAKLRVDHPDTLSSMANLAATYWNQGRWDDAEKLQIPVMETRKAKLGIDHPHTLTSMSNLAYTWKSLHFDDKAMNLIQQCSQARQRVLGPKHPITLSTLNTIEKWSRGS